MKSRVMGDYQARFCERFGGAIPPYLLDLPEFFVFIRSRRSISVDKL
jgi:hypothetical protein